jgi:hypothetical protein
VQRLPAGARDEVAGVTLCFLVLLVPDDDRDLDADELLLLLQGQFVCVLLALAIGALRLVRGRHDDPSDVHVSLQLEEQRAILEPWDGIHQIVGRFLERFHYMCTLLFSCVFPS